MLDGDQLRMARVVSPPLNALSKLRQPLTDGEEEVFNFFNEHLAEGWEIYIQPHMNGLRPDFVLVHEAVGIVTVEVKDWNLQAMEYELEETNDGDAPILFSTKNGQRFVNNRHNPFNQANLYRQEVLNLYCPSFVDDPKGSVRLVSSLVIFTRAERKEVIDIFRPALRYYNIPEFYNEHLQADHCAFAGADDFSGNNILSLHPFFSYQNRSGMRPQIAADLRHWLVEPDVSAMQRRKLPLSPRQEELVLTRNQKLHRKIKGPAGSGKSLVLAARAAQLCLEKKDVLIVAFNITLLNYLEDLAVRWPEPGRAPIRQYLQKLNFHSWCKRIAMEAGAEASYSDFWKKHFEAEEQKKNSRGGKDEAKRLEQLLDEQMAIFMQRIITRHSYKLECYDAILVDEGQDFNPTWWNCLRALLKPDGEMILAADETQDIYEKGKLWTDDSMGGCGLSRNWIRLDNSFRIPNQLLPLLKDFADRFIPEKTVDLPDAQQDLGQELTQDCSLKWRQTHGNNIVTACYEEVLRIAQIKLPSIVPFADVMVAVSNRALGIALINRLLKDDIKVTHTFDMDADPGSGKAADNRQERRKKLFFYKGDARVKITTIHSLKGLESRSLVLCLDHLNPTLSGKLLYTGLTRLKRSDEGSHLCVVSSVNELANYGRQWPEFQNDLLSSQSQESTSC